MSKGHLEFKVKLSREAVKRFLIRKGYNANDATRLAYSDQVESIQARNNILRHCIREMIDQDE